MAVHALFFFAALIVKQDQTPLRSGCDAEDHVVAMLPAGTHVEVRFRLADGSDCFKIAASLDGKELTGYVPGAFLSGTDQYDQQRASARSVEIAQAMQPIVKQSEELVARIGSPALMRASELIQSNRSKQALEILEPAVKREPKNPNVLLLAGLAAYRADQVRTALDFWKQSLELTPNPALSAFYDRARTEAESDRSASKLNGLHVDLRYEGQTLPADTARAVLATLDEEFTRISSQLGCSADERIVAIVQSRDAYLRSTGAAEWSGGQYDGRIHVSWMDGREIDPQTRKTLAHELAHACLSNLGEGKTRWPAWLQEGMAQKLSGDVLTPNMRHQLAELAEGHQLPHLDSLRQNWARLSSQSARLAYNLSLAAVELMYEHYNAYGIRNILNNPEVLPQVTADLDQKLSSMASKF